MNSKPTADTPATPQHHTDTAWLREGPHPHAREDLIAEAIALVALLFALTIGFVIALLPVTAHAAGADPRTPSLELTAFKIVAAAGQAEQRVPAAQARAGDQLEYQAVYRNPTAATVHHVLVTVPVPATGVEYLVDAPTPRADLASSDGKQFAPLPLMRVETSADGRKISKPAPGADYRFLRWDLGDVPAGATRTVRTRVQLLGAAAPASAVAAR
jgi:hypothetical protein